MILNSANPTKTPIPAPITQINTVALPIGAIITHTRMIMAASGSEDQKTSFKTRSVFIGPTELHDGA